MEEEEMVISVVCAHSLLGRAEACVSQGSRTLSVRVQREMEERTALPGPNQPVNQESEFSGPSLCMEGGGFPGMSQGDW